MTTTKRVVTLCEGSYINATGTKLLIASQEDEEELKEVKGVEEGTIRIDNSVCEKNTVMTEAILNEGTFPEEKPGVVYIVPLAIARLNSHRNDLVFTTMDGCFNSLYTFATNPCLITVPFP